MVRDIDPADFEHWYRAVHPRLVTLLAGATGDADVGRDAADEALVRAFERWSRVSRMASPEGWTYRVGLNVARRAARRRSMERRLLGGRVAPPIPGPTSELWSIVAALPDRQRTAVLLRHVAQLTESEIADVMGVARGTVSSTLRNAHRSLGVAVRDEETDTKEDVRA